jgi:hypothetical protein
MNQYQYSNNPEMSQEIQGSPVFSSVLEQLRHDREVQAMRYPFVYVLSDTIVGQTTLPYTLTIAQGTDFKCLFVTGSMYSYDSENASTFPIPNSGGLTSWAGRGLSVQITDSRSGRRLTSGFVPGELLFSPGYGMNFQNPLPFKYHFVKNSKILFDITNRDNANRTHYFDIALIGYKIETPD